MDRRERKRLIVRTLGWIFISPAIALLFGGFYVFITEYAQPMDLIGLGVLASCLVGAFLLTWRI